MAESRQELVNWVNDILLLNITKVEQCGTGAVYCQLFDSIFRDVPMSKVKFDVNNEYQYITNFKVLQNCFLKHDVDRQIPVERLVKCRFQDNLEFLQWFRRFWDATYPNTPYDPTARRKNIPAVGGTSSGNTSRLQSHSRAGGAASGMSNRPGTANGMRHASGTASTGAGHNNGGGAEPRRMPGSKPANAAAPRTMSRTSAVGAGAAALSAPGIRPLKEKISKLEADNEQMSETIQVIEAERFFYYNKLIDIEELVQAAMQEIDNGAASHSSGEDEQLVWADKYAGLVREIQEILYKTTEGFEIPVQEETEELDHQQMEAEDDGF